MTTNQLEINLSGLPNTFLEFLKDLTKAANGTYTFYVNGTSHNKGIEELLVPMKLPFRYHFKYMGEPVTIMIGVQDGH